MKYIVLGFVLALGACSSYDSELQAQLEAERDFHAHQQYLEDLYTNYDFEYVDDCLTYEEIVCEFE
jgi:hypothetical protein